MSKCWTTLVFTSFPWVYLGPRPREKAQHGCQVIFHKPNMFFAQTSMYFLNISLVTPFWHRAIFYFPLINGKSKKDFFPSGFIGWSSVTHSVNIIITKKKILVMAFKAFHLCNLISDPTLLRNSEHLWFIFMGVHGFYQAKEKSDPVMFPQRTTWLKICWTRTISHDVIAPDVS